MDGNGLSTTVSMDGTSTQTDAKGKFLFEDVTTGTHTLVTQAEGKLQKETSVTITSSGNGTNAVWDVALPNEGTTVAVNAVGETEASVTSETIEGNDEGAVTVDITISESTLPDGTSIIITPVYSIDETENQTRAITRVTENVLLIGTNVEYSDANTTLTQPITLTYDVDSEVAQTITAQKYVNGQWVDADFTVDGGQVTVFADQFTPYTLLLGANVTSTSSSVNLEFEQDLWDNLYGRGEMSIGSATFTYHIGTETTSSGTNRVTAYLIEILARMAGASVTTTTGSYPIDMTLPIATALRVSGTQQVTTLTVSALNRSVSGKQYGDLSIVTTTYNREHNGGSEGN